MVELKSAGEIAAMREAGRAVAAVLAAVAENAAAGVTLRSLDALARSILAEHGAKSTFLGYQPGFAPVPFPAVICASVNDAALHGIPGDARLADGDVVSIDCGAEIDGWTGDAAITFIVGTPRPADARLAETTRRALQAGIGAAAAGARLGDISHAIGQVGRRGGYGINTDFGGHGIGLAYARGSVGAQRGPAKTGHAPAARARARHRALVHGRRPRWLPCRRRWLDAAHRGRQPCRALRAHGRHHR